MRKRKDKQPDNSVLETQAAPPDAVTPAAEIETPKIDTAKIETPTIETQATETQAIETQASADAQPPSDIAAIMAICPQIADAPSIAPPSDEVLKAEIAKVMSSTYEPAIPDDVA